MVGWDFVYYWHRASHEVRLLWAAHENHHSSEYFNLSTALRQSWTPFTSPLFYAPLPLLGFSPAMIATQISISLIYQFWIHTELIDRLPRWFEAVFNTPSHHRVHHGANVEYLDRNHGGHPDRLGSPVRNLRARARARRLRAHEEHRDLHPVRHRVPRVGRDRRATCSRPGAGAIASGSCGTAPAGTRRAERVSSERA